jgi:hypothetical protein
MTTRPRNQPSQNRNWQFELRAREKSAGRNWGRFCHDVKEIRNSVAARSWRAAFLRKSPRDDAVHHRVQRYVADPAFHTIREVLLPQ